MRRVAGGFEWWLKANQSESLSKIKIEPEQCSRKFKSNDMVAQEMFLTRLVIQVGLISRITSFAFHDTVLANFHGVMVDARSPA